MLDVQSNRMKLTGLGFESLSRKDLSPNHRHQLIHLFFHCPLIHLCLHPPIYMHPSLRLCPIHRHVYPPICPPVYLRRHPSIRPLHIPSQMPTLLPTYSGPYLPTHLSSTYPSTLLSIHSPVHPSTRLFYLPIGPSAYSYLHPTFHHSTHPDTSSSFIRPPPLPSYLPAIHSLTYSPTHQSAHPLSNLPHPIAYSCTQLIVFTKH